VGTVGQCAKGGCHSECSAASGCYTWLNGRGYIAGGINNNGLFTWTSGGFMPKNGPSSNPQAVTDFAAWTAAGSLNN
jgi:hypothetical protein